MKITFLGTGASPGIPMLGCNCPVCTSNNAKNKRLRASILVQSNGHNYLVDTSSDLRQQCLKSGVKNIDAIFFTHHHADHILGLEELRAFYFFQKKAIPCYGNETTFDEIKKTFHYVFEPNPDYQGTVSQLDLLPVNGETINFSELKVKPLEIDHGSLKIIGYKFNNSAYITDCNNIPEKTEPELRNLDLLILNALRYKPHPTHFNFEEAIKNVQRLKPKRVLFTHMNHEVDHETANNELPSPIELAYDGMTVEI